MRFKLTLRPQTSLFGNAIPLNYQYEQSAVIYHTLATASEDYADWLHENGFQKEGKQFRLFTFSRLRIPKFRIDKQNTRLFIESDNIEWQISFLPEKSTETFITGLFNKRVFELGDRQNRVSFEVERVEALPTPSFDKDTIFETLSPLCISQHIDEGKRTLYLSPSDDIAAQALFEGLKNRYEAFYGKSFVGKQDFKFELINEPKSALIKIKANTPAETRIKGYMCKFKLFADPELLNIAYQSGLGEKGAMGFGCIGVVDKTAGIKK